MQRALGRGPGVTDSESRSWRWEIMVWSKTTSSGNRVSAGMAVGVLGHTEPRGGRRDPTFRWITGLRPRWPLCRYTVTNLPLLTSPRSNHAARPVRTPRYNQSKCGTAGCSWENRAEREGGWMEGERAGGEEGGRDTESGVVTQQLRLWKSLNAGTP